MESRLGFGLRNEKGELWFSTEHWLTGFKFEHFPPIGLVLRFDVPDQDDEGRWAKNSDGTYYSDGGDPIHAKIKGLEAHVDPNTDQEVIFLHVELETDEGDPEEFAANWPRHSEREKVERLIEFKEYLHRLTHASKTEVSVSESGFTQEQSHFLQNKMFTLVSEVADHLIDSFHESEIEMVKSIEKVLKKNGGLCSALVPAG